MSVTEPALEHDYRSGSEFLQSCSACLKPRRQCGCLHDVLDPSAFVHATINSFCRSKSSRGPIVLGVDEREELHAEGLAILHKLAEDYIPQMAGYSQPGRFSGHAAMYLPRKLGDAWHRLHAEHQLSSDKQSGKRKWSYGERAVSLQALTAEDPDRSELLADRRRSADIKTRLHAALWARWCEEVKAIVQVGELLSEGATPADVAVMLAITPAQVAEAMKAIEPVISALQSEER